MKKLCFLCAAFALCLVFSSALAETIPLEYPQSFDYTQELTRGNFTITIPSSFSLRQEYTDDLLGYVTAFYDPHSELYIMIYYDDSQPRYRNAGELIDAHLEDVRKNSTCSFELARADECMALILSYDGSFGSVASYIYNMDERLYVTAMHGTSADDPSDLVPLRALIDGILAHIVAPEQPLK